MITVKLKYPQDSAGRRMVENVPLANPQERISDVKKMLFEKMRELETINYIYVVDGERKLVGVFTIKEVFRKPEETRVKDIMAREIVKTHPYTDQERVAILALKHNLKSIPVVAKDNKFLGVVSSDIILDILHSEHLEDILRHGGIRKYDFPKIDITGISTNILVKARLPWLVFGLFGGILAAKLTGFFETPLKSHFILAAFIPLIVYMADAVGTQTETLFIRSLAINPKLIIRNYLFREIKIGFLIAIFFGVLLSFISYFWTGFSYIGLILGISIFLTIMVAIFVAIFIPYLLDKFKKDPAFGSGPFATIVQDILSLIIYFSVATFLLGIFR